MLTASYILTTLVAVLLIGGALIPKGFTVKRSIFIQQPVNAVFDFVLDLNKFNRWSPWYTLEPNATYSIVSSKQPGDSYHWIGKGEGKISIIQVDPVSEIKIRIEFIKPWSKIAQTNYMFESKGEGVLVTWQYDGTGSYPVGRFFNLLMDRFLGKDFEKGLSKLKAETENNKSS